MAQKRLENAISQYQSKSSSTETNNQLVEVRWKPYQIDPQTNPNGETFESYNKRRWGGSGWTLHLKQEGRNDIANNISPPDAGATFHNWKWWPNTFKAHQLVYFAEVNGNMDSHTCNSILFKAIYEEGQNISNLDTLVQIGVEKMNLNRVELRLFLELDKGAEYVRSEIRRGKQNYDIRGVPFFILDEKYAFSGAQPPSVFLQAFEKLASTED